MPWYKKLATGVVAIATMLVPAISSVAANPESGESHCVVEVAEQKPNGELVLGSPICFDRLTDALEHAEHSRLEIDSISARGLESVATLSSSFVLGTHFDGYNGSGSSISVVGNSCTGGWWNTSSAWDNRISSSYNGCYRLRHFDLPNKAGDRYDTTGVGQTDNLSAAMNNRTESVAYYGS